MNTKESFPARLCRLRRLARHSQRALAERAGLARGTVQGIESLHRRMPSAATLLSLARALGVDPWYLLYGKEKETA